MRMAQLIRFHSEMVKTCWFATLRDLGYATNVSIANQLPKDGLPAQSLILSLQLFDSNGAVLKEQISLGELAAGHRKNIDLEEILVRLSISSDVVGVIHQTPATIAPTEEISIALEDIYRWIAISDDFIGYTNIATGLKSGLHYQSGPMNDDRISSSKSIIMQSPKIVISDRVDTQLLIFTPSSYNEAKKNIPFHLAILDADGNQIAQTSMVLALRQRALISIKEMLTESGKLDEFISKGGFGMLVGLALNGNIVPLSLATDKTGGLAIDHTLPPPYYISKWNLEERKRTTNVLVKKFFPQVVDSR